MMPVRRPEPVGHYEVLQDHEVHAASIRVIQMEGNAEAVEPHLHHFSQQVYIALEGRAVIIVDGVEHVVEPYAAVTVPRGSVHTARPLGGTAVVMNISLPPLQAHDQEPLPGGTDLRLPVDGSDVED